MIQFSCPHCQKLLFARPEFALRRGPCPGCGVIIAIPQASQPGPGVAVPSGYPAPQTSNNRLVDMELGPEAAPVPDKPLTAAPSYPPRSEFAQRFDVQLPPRTMTLTPPSATGANASTPTETAATAAGAGLSIPGSTPASPPAPETAVPAVLPAPAAPVAPVAAPATRRCPTCAEVIQADAKKCRFCGAILDERLREEARAEQELQQRELQIKRATAMAERNVNVWRSLSIIVASLSAGWLFYLSLMAAFRDDPPWAAIVFNFLLIVGLLRTSREMKFGPAPIFVATALALVLCMPLSLKMGIMVVDDAWVEAFKKSAPEGQPPLTREQIESAFYGMFTFAGLVFSVPLWISALKVAGLQRLRQGSGPGGSRGDGTTS